MFQQPKLIGQILKEMGLVTDAQIKEALAAQRLTPAKRFAEVLIERRVVTPNQIAEALIRQWRERFSSYESGSLFIRGIKQLLAKTGNIFDLQKALINVLEELEDAQEELQVIYRISSAIVQEKEFYQLLRLIAEEARLFTRSERATIFFRQEDRLISWVAEKVDGKIEIALSEGVAGWVVTHNQTYFTNDVSQDKFFQAKTDQMTGYKTKSLLAVPIDFGGENIGVLEVMNKEDGYSEYDSARLNKLSNQIGVVVKKLWLEEAVRQRTKELEESHLNLTQKVKELQESQQKLKEAQAQLVQAEKMAAVGHLASGVAHEINNPLTAITMNTAFLLDLVKDDERLTKKLKIIEKESDRATEIVRGLLTFARKSKQIEKQSVDIHQIIEDTFKPVEHQMSLNNIKVVREFSSDLPPVSVNTNQIQQVFLNIINNARDVMTQGGQLLIKTKAGKGNRILVEFTDTGEGIPPEEISTIFDPFYTTKSPGKGTGLGLAISYEIIKNHNGDIEVNSKVGKGTTFRVILPVGTPNPA